jgi:hypothetical protein
MMTGWRFHLEKYIKVNGKDYPIYQYISWKIKNVPNHQMI